MAEKKIYIGSVGPFLFDDDDPIDDPDGDFTGVHQKALVSDKQMMITEAPSANEHVLRLQDLAGRILTPVAVSDINDPSTELGALSGAPGVLIVVYQVGTDEDESTLYSWDSAVSTGVNIPFVVAGSSGFWIARSGKYSNDQGVYKTITGDDGSTTANKSNDSLAIEGGSGIETEVTEDKVTINATGGGSGVDWIPIATSGNYTIPTGKSFIGGDEFSVEGTDTLSIEGTGRMILVG